MGKPPTFIENVESPDIDREKEEAKHGANPKAIKATYVVVAVLLAVLFVLVAIALHVPRGE